MKKRSAIPELTEPPTPDNNPFEGDRQFVGALWRGLEVLRAFRPKDRGLTNQELSERTGLGTSTISRLSYTLSRLGYLKYDTRTGSYHLGVPVLSLGFVCLAGVGIRAQAQPIMQELADTAGDGYLVALATREMTKMTYLACARTDGTSGLFMEVGNQIPLSCTALGWAYMSHADAAEREMIFAALEEQLGDEWPVHRAKLEKAAEDLTTRGFCICVGDWRQDLQAVSVPIAAEGYPSTHFSLSIGGPVNLTSREALEGPLAQALKLAAHRIARYMG